ncbi:hypothetical protein Tco_1099607 [Tanacetum coccineum]
MYVEVILGTDDETSLNDDTSSNDEISLSEDIINYLSGRDVEWQLPKNTQEEPPKPHYPPIKTQVEEPLPLDIVYPHLHVASSVMGSNRTGKAHYGFRSLGSIKEEMVHVKKPYNMVKVTNVVLILKASNSGFEEEDADLRCSSSTPFSTRVKTKRAMVIHDEGDDRNKYFVIRGRKGKEKVIENEGICRKGNKADVTIYKRAMVNGKAKMVKEIGAVKRGKERGVVIEDGGLINDGWKETMVTKRAIGSRKIEGKSVKVDSE